MYDDLCNGSANTNTLQLQLLCRKVDMMRRLFGDAAAAGGTWLANATQANDTMDGDGGGREAADEWGIESTVRVVVPLFFGVIGLAGLLGNALVIIVVVADQKMRSTTNLLIINLAVSDILFVIFCVPFTATDYVVSNWPFGDLWCKVVQYLIVVTCHASVYTLVLMSFDRYLAVVYPITSKAYRTEHNAAIAIWTTWLVIVTTAIPVAVSHGVLHMESLGLKCIFLTEFGYNLRWFQVGFFMSSYVIPLALISLLYMGMLSRLWEGPPGCNPSAESRRARKRVTRMVYIVVIAFAVCWLPIQVILVAKSYGWNAETSFTISLQIGSHMLAYMNSCVNPVLYAFLSENFRKAFRKFVRIRTPMSTMEQRAGGARMNNNARSNTNANEMAVAAAAAAETASGTKGKGIVGGGGGCAIVGAEVQVTADGTTAVALNVGECMSRADIL